MNNSENINPGRFKEDELKEAARSGKADKLLNKLSDQERMRLNEILSDKSKLEQVLKSDQAKQLMKLFGAENNKNG